MSVLTRCISYVFAETWKLLQLERIRNKAENNCIRDLVFFELFTIQRLVLLFYRSLIWQASTTSYRRLVRRLCCSWIFSPSNSFFLVNNIYLSIVWKASRAVRLICSAIFSQIEFRHNFFFYRYYQVTSCTIESFTIIIIYVTLLVQFDAIEFDFFDSDHWSFNWF